MLLGTTHRSSVPNFSLVPISSGSNPVHIVHALEQGMKTIEVRTVDTIVIAILAGAFFKATIC